MENAERQRIVTIAVLMERAKTAFTENGDIANGVCVSLLHDAVEHALFLTTSKHNVLLGRNPDFKDLVESVAKIYEQNTTERLPYRTPLATFNKVRVAFKHDGVVPARAVTIEVIDNATAFLKHLFERLYDLDIESFDLSDGVRTDAIRDQLKRARVARDNGDFPEAARACAEASALFESAIRILFVAGNPPTIPINTGDHRIDRYAQSVVKNLLRYVLANDAAMLASSLMLGAGMSHLDLAKFREMIPHFSQTYGGQKFFVETRPGPSTKEDVDFLIRHMARSTLWLEQRFPTLCYNGMVWHI